MAKCYHFRHAQKFLLFSQFSIVGLRLDYDLKTLLNYSYLRTNTRSSVFKTAIGLVLSATTYCRHGHEVKAGRLSVYKEGNDVVARAHCDNEQGFILLNNRFAEMRLVPLRLYSELFWKLVYFHLSLYHALCLVKILGEIHPVAGSRLIDINLVSWLFSRNCRCALWWNNWHLHIHFNYILQSRMVNFLSGVHMTKRRGAGRGITNILTGNHLLSSDVPVSN